MRNPLKDNPNWLVVRDRALVPAGAWARDAGFRIDHLLLSPSAADRLADAGVDRATRGNEKASDHAPTWIMLR